MTDLRTASSLADQSTVLMRIAAGAAMSVGDLLRQGLGRTADSIRTKAHAHDIVTEYDLAAERVIRRLIEHESPGSRWVGEELGSAGDGPVTWYVDPIDGTSNFAAGLPFFCTSIGVEIDGELVAGAVYDPVRDELFTADLRGAWVNDQPLRSVGAGRDTTAVLLTDYPAPNASTVGAGADAVGALQSLGTAITSFRTVRRLGSGALMLAYVAAGRADVTMGFDTSPWDVAAGAFLVKQAGGCYLPFDSGGCAADTSWRGPHYVAHVGGFDLAGSSLRPLIGRDDV